MRRSTTALSAGLVACVALTGWQLISRPDTSAVGKIRHVVVIFQENISYDHYFATYPHAANPPGEPVFIPLPDTPQSEGLSGAMLTANPNLTNTANGPDAGNPFRLDRAQGATADQDHSYTAEQTAFDNGKMDLFPKGVGKKGAPPLDLAPAQTRGLTMGYFDGNTVTALWNYAQHFAMSDHYFGTTFGPSTPGHINLISGQTNGVIATRNGARGVIDGGGGSKTMNGDPDPIGDVCSAPTATQVTMGGNNIGDLLNEAKVTWGWFQGGFDLDTVNTNFTDGCLRSTVSLVTQKAERDYVPHHEPFQFYPATANPNHLRPVSVADIGRQDRANHQYDMNDFFAALAAGNLPTVSFLKPPAYANGHAGNSDPLDEQTFIVHVMNLLQKSPEWRDTAVFITYDDSDGWYDHVMNPLVNGSAGPSDALNGPGKCGDGESSLPGIDAANAHAQGRCGYGPRLPLLAVSPWAKANYVEHRVSDQTSIIRFIEDTYLRGKRLGGGSFDSRAGSLNAMFDFSATTAANTRPLLLDENTGLPIPAATGAARGPSPR